MPDEGLNQQMKELVEKLKKRDEEERKRGEQEFRRAMDRDTAGTVLGLFRLQQMQIASLQAQFDIINPLAPLSRTVAELNARLSAIEAALSKEAAKVEGE